MGQDEPRFTVVSRCPDEFAAQLEPLLARFGLGAVRCLSPTALATIGCDGAQA